MSPHLYFLGFIPLITRAQFTKLLIVQYSTSSSFPLGLNSLYSSRTVIYVHFVGWRNKFFHTFKRVRTCHFVYRWQYLSSGEKNLFEECRKKGMYKTSHPCLMHFANILLTQVRTMNLEVRLNPLYFFLSPLLRRIFNQKRLAKNSENNPKLNTVCRELPFLIHDQRTDLPYRVL